MKVFDESLSEIARDILPGVRVEWTKTFSLPQNRHVFELKIFHEGYGYKKEVLMRRDQEIDRMNVRNALLDLQQTALAASVAREHPGGGWSPYPSKTEEDNIV